MKFKSDKRRVMSDEFPPRPTDSSPLVTRQSAFTLIEIMVVVGILLIVMAAGVPAIMGGLKKEGMRKAVDDVVEVCRRARAQAIINGVTTEVRFQPQAKQMAVGAASAARPADSGDADAGAKPASSSVAGYSAQMPDSVTLEMLDVNLIEYKDADEAVVKFYPNGTCDELTVILHSDQNEWRKISLEITTGLASVGEVR